MKGSECEMRNIKNEMILFERKVLNQNGILIARSGHGHNLRWFNEKEFRIERIPPYVKDILIIIDKKTGTKKYHWVDDYGCNEVKSFKEYIHVWENDDCKLEVIENPNYDSNDCMSQKENVKKR